MKGRGVNLDSPTESDRPDETAQAGPVGEGLIDLYDDPSADRLEGADVVAETPDLEGRFEDPERWVDTVNAPGRDQEDGRERNCVLCAQAVESTWRGEPAVAPPLEEDGLTPQEAAELFDGEFRPASYDSVAQQLRDAGPGSSAVVFAYTPYGSDSSGHAFNAVNHDGRVLLVDGQEGSVTDWPGPYADGFPTNVRALVRDREGNPL